MVINIDGFTTKLEYNAAHLKLITFQIEIKMPNKNLSGQLNIYFIIFYVDHGFKYFAHTLELILSFIYIYSCFNMYFTIQCWFGCTNRKKVASQIVQGMYEQRP